MCLSILQHMTLRNKTKTYFCENFHVFLSIYLTLVYIFIQNKPCSNQRVLFPKPMLQMMQSYTENTQCIYD